ncbi:MAG: hypothetical protein PWP10_2914 [Clostridiales bacterium]|jgi:ABC-type nitrate/sulfonate/bicarbonate transport system substrate-binding protein|nr:hypothetical protein [Clostridiales bacterium]
MKNEKEKAVHQVVKTINSKSLFSLILVIIMMISFTACSGSSDKNGDEPEEVKFLLDWLPNTNHTGLYVADSLGYYDDAGLKVSITQPGEGSALSLVAAGEADFCVTFQEEIAAALTSDSPLPVTTVATLIQHNTSGIISLAEKNIVSPADMAGHSYATWDTPIEKAIIGALMNQDGGNIEDVEMIPNTVTDVVTALQTDIDMVWIYYAWDGIAAEMAGLDTNFIDFGQENSSLDFYTPVLASSNKYLEENSETAKKFLEATARGYEYAIENPEEAAKILVEAAEELDPELVEASQKWLSDQYKAEVDQWGYIDQSRWDNFMNWMYENDLITRELKPAEGFTNDYLK